MQLKDVREFATFYTGQLSTSIRALGLGGLGFVWLLSKDEHDRVVSIQAPLRWATGFLVAALTFDLLQYFVAGLVWRRISVEREERFNRARDLAEAAARSEEAAKIEADLAAAMAQRAAGIAQRAMQANKMARAAILHSEVLPSLPIRTTTSLEEDARKASEAAEYGRVEALKATLTRLRAEVARDEAAKITESRWHRAPAVVGYYLKVVTASIGYAVLLGYAWSRFF